MQRSNSVEAFRVDLVEGPQGDTPRDACRWGEGPAIKGGSCWGGVHKVLEQVGDEEVKVCEFNVVVAVEGGGVWDVDGVVADMFAVSIWFFHLEL